MNLPLFHYFPLFHRNRSRLAIVGPHLPANRTPQPKPLRIDPANLSELEAGGRVVINLANGMFNNRCTLCQ
jgi:hypothetical protein